MTVYQFAAGFHAVGLLVAVACLLGGFLPAAPGERSCTWCDFLSVCGPDEPRRVARKMREKLGDLDALREMP